MSLIKLKLEETHLGKLGKMKLGKIKSNLSMIKLIVMFTYQKLWWGFGRYILDDLILNIFYNFV